MKTTKTVIQILFAVSLFVTGPALAKEDVSATETMDVTSAVDYVAAHDDAIILDVRTPIEFEMSHVTGAINVDVQDDTFEAMLGELDPDKTYIVHCTKNPVGGRSSRALVSMQEMGFTNLYSLEGGYIAWKEADLPLTEEP